MSSDFWFHFGSIWGFPANQEKRDVYPKWPRARKLKSKVHGLAALLASCLAALAAFAGFAALPVVPALLPCSLAVVLPCWLVALLPWISCLAVLLPCFGDVLMQGGRGCPTHLTLKGSADMLFHLYIYNILTRTLRMQRPGPLAGSLPFPRLPAGGLPASQVPL